MCRFVGYLGDEILLSDLIFGPENSLIRQSLKSRERPEPVNGDGFGVGWYQPAITPDPCLFTSITPAWNNRNLQSLSSHIASSCFFAHVRAASPGMQVSRANCHPFANGVHLWMHNGTIENFRLIKRRLLESLPDDLYHGIQGTTDSEHAFALFLKFLRDRSHSDNENQTEGLVATLEQTITTIEDWVSSTDPARPSMYNFAVTDGHRMAAVRYTSRPTIEPISLYFRRIGGDVVSQAIIIASEKLTDSPRQWTRVAPNHVLSVDQDLRVNIQLFAMGA